MVGAALLVAGIATVVTVRLSRDTTLEVQVRDAVSGGWVWDLTMRVQGREIYGYYQSDSGLMRYRFTHLHPGPATLQIGAPAYSAVELPVVLRRGANRIDQPVNLVGTEIPNLRRFYVFETVQPSEILCQLRPADSQDRAISNHPCMDLWIGCRVSLQMKNGVSAQQVEDQGSTRGEELFRGEIPWKWDGTPETRFRYTAHIPRSQIRPVPGAYVVIDYIIVEPDPSGVADVDALMQKLFAQPDFSAIPAALDKEKDRLRYFQDSSWNVRAGQE